MFVYSSLKFSLSNLRNLSEIRPDPCFRKNARIRILNQIATSQKVILVRPGLRNRLWVIVTKIKFMLATLALLLTSGVSLAFASQNSLPTDILYPVKLFSEGVRLELAPNNLKPQMMNIIFEHRMMEIEASKSMGNQIINDKVRKVTEENINRAKKLGIYPDEKILKVLGAETSSSGSLQPSQTINSSVGKKVTDEDSEEAKTRNTTPSTDKNPNTGKHKDQMEAVDNKDKNTSLPKSNDQNHSDRPFRKDK